MDQFSLFDMMTARWANFDSQESQSRIILEPILEETSDDDEETKELWSISQYETSWSSSSDTGSVIKLDSFGQEADCISERDFLCPPKRRRHEWGDVLAESTPKRYDHKVRVDTLLDEPDFHKRRCRLEENTTHEYNSDSESSLSRTSSLIQFESLEKQLQNENQLYSSSPLLFTYDPSDGNKYSTAVSSAPYKVANVTVDVDKTVSADKTIYSDSVAFKGVTGNFTYYNHHQYSGGECDSLIETGATSNESDDSTKKCSCTVRSEDLTQQKGKSSLENLSEDSGYCEHSIQLRQKSRSSRQIEPDSEICTVFSTRQFLKRPVSDPTNGGGFIGSTFGKQPPVIASDCACEAGSDRGVCKCNKKSPGKLLCRDEEISQRTSSGMYVNTTLKISTMDSANSTDGADAKNTNKRRRNTQSLLKTSSHSLPNIFYHSTGDGEDRALFCLTSDFSSETTPGRFIVTSANSSKRSSVGRDPYTDFLKVTSYPEGLNSYESSDSFDDIDFYSGGDSVCSGSIAQQNLDLNNFRVARKSKGPQFIQPKPVNVTASCNNLTALDYGDQYGARMKMSDHFKKKINEQRSFIENPEITLLDEISYNFDRNLSIMNDQKPDYDPACEEMTIGVLCIKPPQPPPRSSKKIISAPPSSPPPLPPRSCEKSISKDSLSFDRDPTNLVTCYAASLERCNFTLADSMSTIDKACEEEKEIPTYKYNFSVSQHNRLILSTPNLSSFDGSTEKRSSVEIKDEKGPMTGILNTTVSKGSLFKEVSFHPIVAEISWKNQHDSDSPDDEEEDDDDDDDDDHAEDADDDDDSEDDEKSEQPDHHHHHVMISNDHSVSVLLPERDSEIMDNVPKADEPTDKCAGSVVDNTTPVSRIMVVQEETSRRLAAHESSSAKSNNVMDMTNNSSVLVSAKSAPIKSEKKRKGGFFSRLSNLRFSLRKSSKNKNNNNKSEVVSDAKNGRRGSKKSENVEIETSRDFIYIPLKEPIVRRDERVNNEISGSGGDTTNVDYYQHSPRFNQRSNNVRRMNGDSSDYYRSMEGTVVVSTKPPLPKQPPRVVGVCAKRHGDITHAPRASSTPREIDVHRRYMDISSTPEHHHQYHRHQRPGTTAMISENKIGLIETNLDTHETIITGKTRSLMELGTQRLTHPNVLTSEIHHHTLPVDEPKRPHKSMEFLLDKENQRYTLPPENELQKTHETPLSEHQLRVQASLQRLNIPDWYKQYNTSLKPAENRNLGTTPTTNYRKRNTEYGKWAGLSSKTTSLSSLGSQRADKGSLLLSPSSHSHHGNTGFSRWSTSHLNSTQTSPSISGRSSFSRGTVNSNYMSGHSFINPNVGTNIRSSYRQPYLGWRSQEKLAQPRTPAERLASTLLSQQQQQEKNRKPEPENAEIQTSIKEVTSAIVHYVNDQNSRNSRSRSTSPNLRKCWLESSFVGIGPVDQSPQTPTIDRNFSAQQQQQISRLASNSAHVNGVGPQIPMLALPMERPSPGSATLEDVLASLLGLPAEPSNRSSSGVTGNNVKEAGSRENLLSVESVPLRRHSEGDAAKKKCSATDPRRVSLDSSDVSGGGPSRGTEMIKCRYHKCESTATVAEAKKHYKSCHNCSHLYCSRECRRAHWERHRRTCLHLRLSSLCRQVLSACRDEPDTLRNLSLLAKRGYLSQGRGVVRILFRSPESAEKFCKQGFPHIGETTYVRWQDLTPTEMGPELYSELLRLAGEYRVETKMLIYVAICVVSEAPGPAATAAPVKWERQLVSRCAKLKICKTVLSDLANLKPAIHRPDEDMDILILTFNGVRRGSTSQNRELLLHNVQGILKQRGVNLRKNYPDVFQRLNTFVDGTSERFLPVTLHPKDSTTGRTFVCIIMPHSGDPEQLKLPNSDAGSHVQVVNVSLEHLDQLTAPAK